LFCLLTIVTLHVALSTSSICSAFLITSEYAPAVNIVFNGVAVCHWCLAFDSISSWWCKCNCL